MQTLKAILKRVASSEPGSMKDLLEHLEMVNNPYRFTIIKKGWAGPKTHAAFMLEAKHLLDSQQKLVHDSKFAPSREEAGHILEGFARYLGDPYWDASGKFIGWSSAEKPLDFKNRGKTPTHVTTWSCATIPVAAGETVTLPSRSKFKLESMPGEWPTGIVEEADVRP